MEKKTFKVPVEWEVWDFVEVEAESFEKAIKYVLDNKDEIPLGTTPEYIDGSYKISSEEEILLCTQDPRFPKELADFLHNNFGYGNAI